MTAKTQVFVVSGSTGEYEDEHDWTVKAFFTKKRADNLAAKLNAWCVEQKVHCDTPKETRASTLDMKCPLDSRFHESCSTGVQYRVWTLNVEGVP